MKRKQSLFAAIVLSAMAMCSMAQAQNDGAVWIEAENTASANMKVEAAGWGNTQFLSEGKWVNINIAAEKVGAELRAGGGMLSYKFSLKSAGKHEIWDRVGFEFVRSPFEWRVDGGEWNKSSPDDLTVDLMPLAEWTEVAWLKLGERDLKAGDHTLDIRLSAIKNEKGEAQRVLYASDAIVISAGAFRPNGWHKPGQSGRNAADEAAAKNVFKVAAVAGGARSEVKLKGQWEIARDDESLPKEIAVPIASLPRNPLWKSIAVPSDKAVSRPELTLAHRVWYRTQVEVPANMAGRSFFINFPKNNLNTTIYVNGQLCGFEKQPFVNFDVDVTKAIKPGANEIMVGIRDAWYGFSFNPDNPMPMRKLFNFPVSWKDRGFMNLDYPVWNAFQSGILNTPTFVAAGAAYVSDVFAQPSVAKKQLVADIEVTNPSAQVMTGEIQWEAINVKTGKSEKTFPPKPFTVAARKNVVVKAVDAWADPQLWWPDSPTLYDLRTTLVVEGKPVDIANTRFGFREWNWEGTMFKLNGINWQMWHGGGDGNWSAAKKLEYHHKYGRLMRFGTEGGQSDYTSQWNGLEGKEALNFFDENGYNLRRKGPIDGQVIGYMLWENDEAIKAKQGGSNVKMELMKNTTEQMVKMVKGERNHPSIQIWALDNEYMFINVENLGGSDAYEPYISRMAQAVAQVDPTRPSMVDGGGALKDNSLPVHGDHYVFDINDPRYPDLAYEDNEPGSKSSGRGRWVWDKKRPRYMGEDYFAVGFNPADYAQWGGEVAFQSKKATKPISSTMARMITEGYRWSGVAAFEMLFSNDVADVGYEISYLPQAAFIRQWNWSFESGQNVTRTVGLFNDTRFADPMTFTWKMMADGKQVSTVTGTHDVAPGTKKVFDIVVPMPEVKARTEGQLLLAVTVNGKEVFRDTKGVSILPAPSFGVAVAAPAAKPATKPAAGNRPAAATRTSMQIITRSRAQMKPATSAAAGVVVFDPQGNVATYLKSRGVAFTALTSLEALPPAGKVLIVGKDAVNESDSTNTRLAAYAAEGRTVIVLEQKNPLKYAALQAEIEPSAAIGNVGFIEDSNHPALRNLKDKDFFTWGANQPLYRSAYVKPTRGARSLVQTHMRLLNTALVEIPTGKGLMLLSQLTIGENLPTNGVARTLLANLVSYGTTFKQTFREVALASGENTQLTKAMDTLGVRYSKATDALGAISDTKVKLAVINASPTNLKQLADNKTRVEAFNKAGGYIVFNNLTPEGLSDYNKIVGFDHMIRPMQRERVTFPAVRDPLLAGATTGDIVMLNGERIFGFIADEYTVSDEFSYIVDYDDVAPFAKSSFHAYGNITNGFVGSDGWPLIINWELPKTENGGFGPALVPLSLPKPQTITEFTWIGNKNYWIPTKVSLTSGAGKKTYTVPANDEAQVLEVKPPLASQDFTVAIEGWQERPDVRPLIGIDNIYLKAQRPADFYQKVKPLLNIGGMMHYPRGEGGMVLANLAFKDSEAVPLNAIKKRNILQALLRNLQAPFGGANVVVGTNINYMPINFGDFQNKLTQYRTNRGWFGDANRTFNALQMGNQKFAGVTFNIYDFATSPVPTAIMLGGEGIPNNPPSEVKDIPINKKADALFFLHTARIDQRRNNDELRDNKKFEMARYIINYADGQSATVPIYSEIDIEHYKQEAPKAISGAQTAWVSPYEGSRESAVAYAKQWNNPRPDLEIKSIDMTYGVHKRGVPVLLAITAATAVK
jgi:beta-galactosidase